MGALVVGAVLLLFLGRTPAAPALPNPNGYDDLVKAGQELIKTTDDPADLDLTHFRALVATNAEPLRRLRLGLTRRCAVPTQAISTNFNGHSHDLGDLKQLARALSAEGRLAELENRPVDAARSYIECIRLGNEISRGGVLITRLVGIAIEVMGGRQLAKLIPKLRCEQMRALVTELEQIIGNSVTWEGVLANERIFARAQMGKDWLGWLNPIRFVAGWWQARNGGKRVETKHDLAAAHLRLMLTELALRRYRCDQGSAPDSLQGLVPKYLRQMPSDPFRGQPLVYRPDGTNWTLLSASRAGNGQAIQADMPYDSP